MVALGRTLDEVGMEVQTLYLARKSGNMNDFGSHEVLVSATRSKVYANHSCLHVLQQRQVMDRVVVFLTHN